MGTPLRPRRAIAAWIALLESGIAPRGLSRLAARFSDAEEIFALPDEQLLREYGLSAAELRRFRTKPDRARLLKSLDAFERHRMALLVLGDPGYPANLFSTAVPPAALFVRGELLAMDRLAIGVVGSRSATAAGLERTRSIAAELAPMFSVVSGCALGIDSAAHAATLRAGGRTIGVCGCGLDIDYPAANSALREAIVTRGALVSCFTPGTKPFRTNFPRRNEILAGLSLAVVVVEAAEKSGALSTAAAAAEEGRQVFAIPGALDSPQSRGVYALLRDGAQVCTGAADIVADLEGMLTAELQALLAARPPMEAVECEEPPPRERAGGADDDAAVSPPPPNPAPPPAPPQTRTPRLIEDPTHAAVHALIGEGGDIEYDNLLRKAEAAGIAAGALAEALLMLELDGAIEQLPGRRYRRA